VAQLFHWKVPEPRPDERLQNGRQRRRDTGKNQTADKGGGGQRQHWAAGGHRKCPFYKRIEGTALTVDAFSYGAIDGCRAYILSHFHADHYGGLTRAFKGRIYCSAITARLVTQRLGVPAEQITVLPMEGASMVEGVRVTPIDANHCPGAVVFLFELPSGRRILHTGDFRACEAHWAHPLLVGRPLHTVYLDTTYCKESHTFPSQKAVLNFAASLALSKRLKFGRLLVVVGSYTIGKERVFRAVAEALGSRIWAHAEKRRVLLALHDEELERQLTTDASEADVHVTTMSSVRLDALVEYAKRPGVAAKYDRILGLRPTGWSHNQSLPALSHIKPQRKGNVEVYGVPYSEHSSYDELKRCVVGEVACCAQEAGG
jgi:DNA cross-link repair 1A protein